MNRCLSLLPVLLAGCSLSGILSGSLSEKTSEWYETGQVRKPREDIARSVRELILRAGYQAPEFDAASGRLETAWDIHLSTRFREGYRTMIEAEILPLEAGGFNVRVRSTMEINDNDLQCNIAERAKWIAAGASEKHKAAIPGPAIKLSTTLRYRFFGLNP